MSQAFRNNQEHPNTKKKKKAVHVTLLKIIVLKDMGAVENNLTWINLIKYNFFQLVSMVLLDWCQVNLAQVQ